MIILAVFRQKEAKMSLRDNKMLIMRQLGLESEPISLNDLLIKLGSGFKERSTRRWLALLVLEGSVRKVGEKRSSKYLAVGRSQEISETVSCCFSSASLEIIKIIKKPLFERQPVAYRDEWLDSYEPNSDCYLSEELRSLLFESGKRAGIHDPAGTYAHQIFNRLLIDLSYNSSRLEGNTYSLLDTERLVLHGDTATGKLKEEKVMILNHKEAIRYLVEGAPKLGISSDVVRTLHYLLSDGLVDRSESGKIRRQSVRIGGSTYMPSEDPKKLENQLEKITAKAALIKNPFEQSIFLLIHVSYLQAFIDVNKRTARLAANISLIKANLVPLAFNDVQVDDYMFAMIAIYELQNVRPLIDLYFYSYMRTCAAYDSTVKAMGFDEIRVRYRKERRALIRDVILKGIVGTAIPTYLKQEAAKIASQNHLEKFIENAIEDLAEIDECSIAGLGVTPDELRHWICLRDSSL